MMDKYRIRTITNDQTVTWHEVDGEPFIIAGYEGFSFFKTNIEGLIRVTEVITGFYVGEPYYIGDKAAHDDIKSLLDSKGGGMTIIRKIMEIGDKYGI